MHVICAKVMMTFFDHNKGGLYKLCNLLNSPLNTLLQIVISASNALTLMVDSLNYFSFH